MKNSRSFQGRIFSRLIGQPNRARRLTCSALLLIFLGAQLLLAADPGAGLNLTEDTNISTGILQGQTVTFGPTDPASGAGPLGLHVSSLLTGSTKVSVSAQTFGDTPWLQVSRASASDTCPNIGDSTYSRDVGFSLPSESQGQTICVVAAPMPGNSVLAGTLTFRTQAGTTIVPVGYTITPGAYLQVFNGNTLIPSGASYPFQQSGVLNLNVSAVDNNGNIVHLPISISPTAATKPDWLSPSAYDLPATPDQKSSP